MCGGGGGGQTVCNERFSTATTSLVVMVTLLLQPFKFYNEQGVSEICCFALHTKGSVSSQTSMLLCFIVGVVHFIPMAMARIHSSYKGLLNEYSRSEQHQACLLHAQTTAATPNQIHKHINGQHNSPLQSTPAQVHGEIHYIIFIYLHFIYMYKYNIGGYINGDWWRAVIPCLRSWSRFVPHVLPCFPGSISLIFFVTCLPCFPRYISLLFSWFHFSHFPRYMSPLISSLHFYLVFLVPFLP